MVGGIVFIREDSILPVENFINTKVPEELPADSNQCMELMGVPIFPSDEETDNETDTLSEEVKPTVPDKPVEPDENPPDSTCINFS